MRISAPLVVLERSEDPLPGIDAHSFSQRQDKRRQMSSGSGQFLIF